ncbi:hypothetical protein FE257_010842 [Aspergillus nanangensis]|uniref:Uncharacterized protein n=1 Tax=Aspergillus nanangensis TaxID=2582783 RepID=A0AAD4GY95_ASPNN|nr:hypothetical protein FE257_010842 [Aspergillus nanangensis]
MADLSFYAPGQRERRAFEYYFHRAAPALSGILDLVFWRGAVLQICRSEPAIWDAIIALSALYERPPITQCAPYRLLAVPLPAVRDQRHREALSWYARSLGALQKRLERSSLDPAVALISCVLFITIELLQGNMAAAVALYRQGIRLIARSESESESESAEIESEASTRATATTNLVTVISDELRGLMGPVFARLGTLTLILAQVAPISKPPVTQHNGFPTFHEARTALYALMTEWKLLNQDAKIIPSPPDLTPRQRDLEAQLLTWHRHFLSMPLHPDRNPHLPPPPRNRLPLPRALLRHDPGPSAHRPGLYRDRKRHPATIHLRNGCGATAVYHGDEVPGAGAAAGGVAAAAASAAGAEPVYVSAGGAYFGGGGFGGGGSTVVGGAGVVVGGGAEDGGGGSGGGGVGEGF